MNIQHLGLCRKAGKLNGGFTRTLDSLKSNKAKLIILSEHLSDKTKKEVRFFAEKHHCPILTTDATIDDLERATGIKAGVFAVCDQGFADKFNQPTNDKETCI